MAQQATTRTAAAPPEDPQVQKVSFRDDEYYPPSKRSIIRALNGHPGTDGPEDPSDPEYLSDPEDPSDLPGILAKRRALLAEHKTMLSNMSNCEEPPVPSDPNDWQFYCIVKRDELIAAKRLCCEQAQCILNSERENCDLRESVVLLQSAVADRDAHVDNIWSAAIEAADVSLEQSDEMHEQASLVEQQKAEIKGLESTIEKLKSQVSGLQSLDKKSEAKVDKILAAAIDASNSEMQAEMHEQASLIKQQKADRKQAKALIKQQKADMRKQAKSLEWQKGQMARQELSIKGLEITIEKLELEVSGLKYEASFDEKRITRYEKSIESHGAQAEENNASVEAQEKEIISLRERLLDCHRALSLID